MTQSKSSGMSSALQRQTPRPWMMSNNDDSLSLKFAFGTAEVCFTVGPPLFPVMHIMKDADMQTPFFMKKNEPSVLLRNEPSCDYRKFN
jgi:hypothetical protein